MSKRSENAIIVELRPEVHRIWHEMVDEGTAFEIGDLETGDDAPQAVLARLGEEWRGRTITPQMIRRSAANANKQGTMAKKPRRVNSTAKRIANSAASSQSKTNGREHSDEYITRLQSPEWRDFATRIKREREWRCQLCYGEHLGDGLQIHHIHYNTLGHERDIDVLCLCKTCHPVADEMRKLHNNNEGNTVDDFQWGQPGGVGQC